MGGHADCSLWHVFVPVTNDLRTLMPTKLTSSNPTEVFISYSREDEELTAQLVKHLANLENQGLITLWYDSRIPAGDSWAKEIEKHLNSAPIILLLVSKSFLASKHC